MLQSHHFTPRICRQGPGCFSHIHSERLDGGLVMQTPDDFTRLSQPPTYLQRGLSGVAIERTSVNVGTTRNAEDQNIYTRQH